MIERIPFLLSAPAAAIVALAIAVPAPQPAAGVSLHYSDAIVLSASLTGRGLLSEDGASVSLLGLQLATASQYCGDPDGGSEACLSSISRFLDNHLAGAREVQCWIEPDQNAVLAARCSVDGSDLNAMLVHAGLARADLSSSGDYSGLETEARRAGAGMWKTLQHRQ